MITLFLFLTVSDALKTSWQLKLSGSILEIHFIDRVFKKEWAMTSSRKKSLIVGLIIIVYLLICTQTRLFGFFANLLNYLFGFPMLKSGLLYTALIVVGLFIIGFFGNRWVKKEWTQNFLRFIHIGQVGQPEGTGLSTPPGFASSPRCLAKENWWNCGHHLWSQLAFNVLHYYADCDLHWISVTRWVLILSAAFLEPPLTFNGFAGTVEAD